MNSCSNAVRIARVKRDKLPVVLAKANAFMSKREKAWKTFNANPMLTVGKNQGPQDLTAWTTNVSTCAENRV